MDEKLVQMATEINEKFDHLDKNNIPQPVEVSDQSQAVQQQLDTRSV